MKAILSRIEEVLCVIALVIMTVLTFANVIARYVFSASFSFSEEITTYLFVLLSLLGSAVAARRKAHLGFTALIDIVPENVRRIFHAISFLLATLFSSALFVFGMKMVYSQMSRGQVTAGMQWPEWIFGAFVPLGAFFITLEFLFLLINVLKGDEEA
ncbi:MAG: TRAP transporter small permease [Selenomonadales bacterium]|nr:TRAP transporter small permease [Selenomonadales bacterium]MDY3740335.1 TRAP transporter small permease [Selenomonadaceae bacterium]MEE1361041.1 TRAP transporter small permease [Selenomonadaceae bacterium]